MNNRESLPAKRISEIDPFGRLNKPVVKDGVELLYETESAWKADTIRNKSEALSDEEESWRNFLGFDIEIPNPSQALFDTEEQAQTKGIHSLKPHYLPNILFKQDDTYPGWHVKPQPSYWNMIDEKSIAADASKLGGNWILIDSTPQTHSGVDPWYPNDPFRSIIKPHTSSISRFNLSWETINQHILPEIAQELSVDPAIVRLPKAIEFNVLGNMHYPKWGEKDLSEWFHDSASFNEALYGGWTLLSNSEGFANVKSQRVADIGSSIAFRPMIVFSV